MTKNYLEKTKIVVSTAIMMTVLTLMLTACSTKDQNGNAADNSNVLAKEVVSTDYDIKKVETSNDVAISDGDYDLYVELLGGSGKSTVTSPAKAKVNNGNIIVLIEWSSPNYDYMIVNGEKYLPVNSSGNSVFEIPIEQFECDIEVIADTVAMSKPHEIEYRLSFSKDNNSSAEVTTSDFENEGEESFPQEVKDWINNHKLTGKLERKYAEKFGVSYYDDKYCILTINGTDAYLLSKNEEDIPSDLPEKISVIRVPVSNTYVVSSASYNYFSTLDALSSISLTSLKKDEVDDEKLNKKLSDGTVKYAGKYSAPDYELLLSEGCSLVVENTMILHSIDVLNQLKKLKINTMIDYSSKESTPLGRMEWIKLYGMLTDKEEESIDIFNEKEASLVQKYENTGKKVAYFYITNSGSVVVRKNQDYIASLIEIAGGEYAFNGLSEYDGTGTMTIQKEAFFEAVSDCDYLLYNTTISGGFNDLSELISKCEVLKNTKAFKDGNIYCTTENIYVKAMELPEIAEDINKVLKGDSSLKYIYKLN